MVLIYREANLPDIHHIKEVRMSVQENRLSDPSRISDADYPKFLIERGKGWICMEGETAAGFCVVDLAGKNVWALFVRPEYEGRGIGKRLHDLMIDWYFSQTTDTIWLGTEPGTRAETFYRSAGWEYTGRHGSNELKFEMTYSAWKESRRVKDLYA